MHQVQVNWVLVVSELLRRVVRVDDRGLAIKGSSKVEHLVIVVVTLVDQRDDWKVFWIGSRNGFPAWERGEAGLLSGCDQCLLLLLLVGVAGVDHLHILHRVGQQGDECARGGGWWGWGCGRGF